MSRLHGQNYFKKFINSIDKKRDTCYNKDS